MSAVWSSQLVEELLFRQYIKGEDVSMLLPPPPALVADHFMEKYELGTKMLSSYVRNGPAATLAPQNVNTASRVYGGTPVKSFARPANQAPTADGKPQGCRTPSGRTPPPAADSPVPAVPNAASRQGDTSPPAPVRRNRVEWPSAVPTNASLKSSSRSKVAHLTSKRVAAQGSVDPDLIFAQNPGELPLHAIFAKFPKAMDSIAAIRGASGDWWNDTFTVEEENQYKRDLGFAHLGPSQSVSSRSNLLQKVYLMVEYPPGTPLWIYCEDGLWWPAAVREADRTSLLGLGEGHDICVEFYHDPGNLCPVVSGNSGVRMFHRVEGERDEDERKLFEVKVTQAAVQRALLDDSRNSLAQKEMVRPYTPKELRCMSALLQSVNHTTASRVREVLARDGINLSLRNKKQPAARKEIKRRKITPPLSPSPPAESIGLPCDEKMVMVTETNVNSKPTVTLDEPSVSRLQSIFQEPFDPSALDVLRKEVFENKERFVLSPLYRYLDLLGAVFVDGVPVETTLPSPIALHEVPDGGLLPSRRVVLVPLSSCTFDHTEGWMMPFEYESTTIAMTLSVNGTVVETPCNSSLPSGKEAIAVKTASVVDITEHVLDKELFSLVVDFTGFIEDMALWRGVIAVVYVNRVEMDVLIDGIVSNYKIAPRRKEHDDVVGVQVKVSCPITTLPLKIPVRGFSCEHLQCVELRSLLMQCARTNVWNCPLCWAPTRPETIIVNYRLKEWLETHRAQTGKVDFILETPTGMSICPIWKQKRSRGVEDVISLE